MLRTYQLGIPFSDLKELSIGVVFDMFVESGNDKHEYSRVVTDRREIERLL